MRRSLLSLSAVALLFCLTASSYGDQIGVDESLDCLTDPAAPLMAYSPAEADIHWDDRFAAPGIVGSIYSHTIYNGNLVVGGLIRSIDGVVLNHIAQWDGITWSSLGDGFADEIYSYGDVNTFCEYNGQLVAGGNFKNSGGETMRGVAAWDGTAWSQVGNGISSEVFALAVFEGELYAATYSPHYVGGLCGLLKLNGTYWTTLHTFAGTYQKIFSMTVFDGRLILAGDFIEDEPGVGMLNNIAAWDGTDLFALGDGTDLEINSMIVSEGQLIVGGEFTTAGSGAASYIAAWDGTAWAALGTGTTAEVRDLNLLSGQVIAAGYFHDSSLGVDRGHMIWNGVSWDFLNIDPAVSSPTSATQATIYNGQLVAFGDMELSDGRRMPIGTFDGSVWSQLSVCDGHGIPGMVNATTLYGDNLVAAGQFNFAGSDGLLSPIDNIALWDGADWTPIGGGLGGEVYALGEYNGLLIAAARHWVFEWAFPDPNNKIAAWDGSSWTLIGDNLDAWHSPGMYTMTVFQDKLAMGGGALQVDGASSGDVVFWDGSTWSYTVPCPLYMVYALKVMDNQLMASGYDTLQSSWLVMSFDGSTWAQVGDYFDGRIYALEVFRDELYAAGEFDNIGSAAANSVARWNGSYWAPVGGGIEIRIQDLHVHHGELIATGSIYEVAGDPTYGVASWSGTAWTPLGSGAYYYGQSMSTFHDTLYIGGGFTWAGGNVTRGLAAWTKPGSCCVGRTGNVDGDINDNIDIGDLTCMVEFLFGSGCGTDCAAEMDLNGDGVEPDIADLTYMVDFLFNGGPLPVPCP